MPKILISSDPNGRFDLLLPKVVELHNKNKFDFMIITGCVCPSTATLIFKDLAHHKLNFPIPTYFIDCSDMSYALSVAHPHGFEVVNNLHYLGNMGCSQIMGLEIAYFSGMVNNTDKMSAGNGEGSKYSKL
jgi:hypothetical protein